jgi:hypothetical protein
MKNLLISVALVLMVGAVIAANPLLDQINERGPTSHLLGVDATKALATIRDFEEVTAANTITFDECGTTYILNSATEFASTLPAPEAGCSFRFIIKGAPSGASYTVVTLVTTAHLVDGSLTVDGTAVPCVDEHTVTFADGSAAMGDQIELFSDGVGWFLQGVGEASGAITCTGG